MSDHTIELKPVSETTSQALPWLAVIFAVWAGIVLVLAIMGVFDVPRTQPALPTLLAITLPVIVFAATMFLSPGLRALALNLDPVLLTEFQAWRILGGMFLAVYAFGFLPGFFAWPAGVGDVMVGVAAPFAAWRLRQSADFLFTPRYRMFHYFGLADFVVAVTTGIMARNSMPGLVDEVTTSAMGQLPLVLIPTIAVPSFIILHLIVLMQISAKRG